VQLHEKSDINNDELALGNHLAAYKTRERDESLLNLALSALGEGITTLHYTRAFCLFLTMLCLFIWQLQDKKEREGEFAQFAT
jgi:hypothetical protein